MRKKQGWNPVRQILNLIVWGPTSETDGAKIWTPRWLCCSAPTALPAAGLVASLFRWLCSLNFQLLSQSCMCCPFRSTLSGLPGLLEPCGSLHDCNSCIMHAHKISSTWLFIPNFFYKASSDRKKPCPLLLATVYSSESVIQVDWRKKEKNLVMRLC